MNEKHLFMLKRDLIEILELLFSELELTESQYQEVKSRYEAVTKWLAEGDSLKFYAPDLFPQGSMRLGTTVKPFGREKFDLDFVCNLARGHQIFDPSHLKKLIGNRLMAHGVYKRMCSEKGRCWRLTYADDAQFHMDITPARPADWHSTPTGYLWVPDKVVQNYKDSAPVLYANWFQQIASIEPKIYAINEARILQNRADIEPFPEKQHFKKTLQRIVQIFKRHRSVYFNGHQDAPISIIITTLAAHAYRDLAKTRVFETQYDLLQAVAEALPDYIEKQFGEYWVTNPVLSSENFAEKWNLHPSRHQCFENWHINLVEDLKLMIQPHQGLDKVQKTLQDRFGEYAANKAMAKYNERRDVQMQSKVGISISPALGITQVNTGMQVRRPQFFGK